MPELQHLRADHGSAILAFETENREFFAASISDRGDEFFEHFSAQLDARLAEQDAGSGAYYVLVDDGGAVLGRFNLTLEGDGVATLGYRVAQHVAGQGVATAAVRDLCGFAASRHGVTTITAATSHTNVASQRVLISNGFTAVGPADPAEIGGNEGTRYELAVSDTQTLKRDKYWCF